MSDNPNPPAEPTTVEPAPVATPVEPAPLTLEQVDAFLRENNYTAFKADDPRLARLDAPDPDPKTPSLNLPDYDPYDPNSVARIVDEKTKDLPAKLAADISKQVMESLSPVLNTFAQNQLQQSVRAEAKPFVDQIMKEFKVTPFQLAQDPNTARLINEAAEARAMKAGKLEPSILFPSDPPGGTQPSVTLPDGADVMIRQSEAFLGRALTEAERAEYVKDYEYAVRKEGLGV